MKVVWLSHSPNLRGAELCLLEGVKGLLARGVVVRAIVPAEGTLADALRGIGCPISVIRCCWWARNRLALHKRLLGLAYNLCIATPRTVGLFRRERPDLVITNTLTVFVGALAAKIRRIPHVWYVHELIGREGQDLRYDFGQRMTMSLVGKLSGTIMMVSEAVRNQWRRRVAPEKLRVVRYAAEVTPSAPRSGRGGAFTAVYVGHLSALKRQEDAIRALALLRSKGLPVRLCLVGGGETDHAAFLQRLARDLGAVDHAEFVAFTRDPSPYVAAADVAVICSIGESSSRVTVEAMKLGKPVIGAASGGVHENIRDGWNGLLYPPGDVAQLAERIERLYRDRALLAQMGSNAQQWASETFNLENYTKDLLSVCAEILSPKRAAETDGSGQSSAT